MSKLMNSLSRSPEIIGMQRPNRNIEMFLKPNKEGEFYRVRLLGPSCNNGRRTDPHITRYVHSVWSTDPNTGKKKVDKVVCPKNTPWVATVGNKKNSCRLCSYVDQQFAIYNESGKTDNVAKKAAGTMRYKFEGIVPVYVVNDPNYEKNNGKCKVIVFDDSKVYKAFREKIQAKKLTAEVFNGGPALDCLIYVGSESVPYKDGSGKMFTKTVIKNVTFSTQLKERPAITEKLLESFPFDETYMSDPTEDEIDEFYHKHCVVENDDIPEDDDIPVYTPVVKQEPKIEMPSNSTPEKDDVDDNDINELIDDSSATLNKKESVEDDSDVPKQSKDIDSEDILAELGLE